MVKNGEDKHGLQTNEIKKCRLNFSNRSTVTEKRGLSPSKWVSSVFLCRVYKAARVTRVGGLPYLRVRVTLAGG